MAHVPIAPGHPGGAKGWRVAFVLWSGDYGGAETWSLNLARTLFRRGIQVGVIVIGRPGSACRESQLDDIEYHYMRLERGSDVLRRPFRFARVVSKMAPDLAVLPSAGFLSAALRLGGYAGQIVAVEHGSLLQLSEVRWPRRGVRLVSELAGVWAADAQVTPSEFMKEELMKYPNCGRIVRIHPGVVLPPRTSPANRGGSEERKDLPLVIGCAARLIPGKGVDVLLRAASLVTPADRVCVRVAGDGPDRGRLKDLAQLLGIGDRTKFEGWVDDMSDFWRGCDVAVVPSHQWVESFGMVVIEAMASGIPVIASRKGGLTEAIVPGVTGAHFQPGDFAELARLLNSYLENKELRERHGAAARSRCQAMFGIERCAADFEDLISGLLSKGPA